MSRWRAPQAASPRRSSPARVTASSKPNSIICGARCGRKWSRRLSAAAAEGDRSENAEYIYRKKQLGEIDRRVRYLTKRLQELKIAPPQPTDTGAVFFGARFEVEDDDGQSHIYRIVGPDETDAAKGWISIDSPLARAALKKRVDDEFEAELPGGRKRFVDLLGALRRRRLSQTSFACRG